MDARERLLRRCSEALKERGLADKPPYRERLKKEILEIDNQAEHEYFLSLYDKKLRFPKNENNLLVAYLLGLAEDFDIESEHTYIQGEFPDIDVDYLPVVQDYLRNDYAPRAFGRDRVVNIGNYGTYGIKSALLDMTRVHGLDKTEIQVITKNLEDKDDEGKPITWDKAVEISPQLSDWCLRNPDVADAAKRLVNRIKNRGKHAGGTVISSTKIDDLVPLMTDTDGNPVSGWTEGLHDQDLQPVGLIKFDVLAIKDLQRIAECCQLIKQRYGVQSICALPGEADWTDISYLNDPKALDLADKAKTRGVFQFDGQGMRNLVKRGGVSSFDDLAAYTALFRPGPLGMKMDQKYIDRKQGRENWEAELPECVKPILGSTYGVMCYQEQVMQILNVVGGIPLIHCEKVRKAISKKKYDQFAKYKDMFLEHGSKKLGWPKEGPAGDTHNLTYLWDQIESFASYGFNKSHAVAYTYISSRLLWLKAHYPLEFFTVTLSLTDDDKKLRSLKREAEHLGIQVCRIDLNRSGVNYQIVDGKIYIGFSNIKGIGREVAEKIIAGQPYSSFEDFLARFGTDARVVAPLLGLSASKPPVFGDAEPHILEEYYEYYKKLVKSRRDREKRNFKRRDELLDSIKLLWPEGNKYVPTHEWVMDIFEKGEAYCHETFKGPTLKGTGFDLSCFDDFDPGDMWTVIKKYGKSVKDFERKEAFSEMVSFADFRPENKVSPEKYGNPFELEKEYYGFSWQHPIEMCPEFMGEHGFSQFHDDDTILTAGVEVLVTKAPEEKVSRNGHKYYYLLVEDEDWNREVVTFWGNDFERFQEELKYWNEVAGHGHFLRIKVTRPGDGFKSYTFYAPPKQMRWKVLPKDKKDDMRLQVMTPPPTRAQAIQELREASV